MSLIKTIDLSKFTAGLEGEQAAIDRLVETAAKRIGMDILSRVVLATPVDTGRARGNWQVGIDRAVIAETKQADPSGGETINEGVAVIAKAEAYQAITIANNLPYIARLNEGASRQAPAGFVEAAIDAATRI